MPILTKREVQLFNGVLKTGEYTWQEKVAAVEKLEDFQRKIEHTEYVEKRNELIPMAEAYASRSSIARSKVSNFSRLFLAEMDRLAREAGI